MSSIGTELPKQHPDGFGDRAHAEALRLARLHLEKMGWKYTPSDVGKTAGEILSGLRKALANEEITS